jgi:hypothetical protein
VFQSRDPVLTVTSSSSSSSRPPVFSFPGYLAFGAGSSSSPAAPLAPGPAAAQAPGPAATQAPVEETSGQMEMETDIPTTVEQEVLDIKEEDEVKKNNRGGHR